MKKSLLIHAAFILLPHTALKVAAQVQCGTTQLHQELMQTDSAYKSGFLLIQNQVHALQNQRLKKTAIQFYTIPVVVHVIHLGEPVGTGTNISDAQIQEAINGLNERFRNIIGNGSLDIDINFCLALSDPNACQTNGINRVNGSGISNYSSFGIRVPGCVVGADEDSIKALSRWPVSDYYNIWIVNNICNGQWGGYAYYPYGGVNDGTVIRSDYMINGSHLLSHEVGHGLNLFHTFEGDGNNASCPIDTNCVLNGDQCCDTPPHKQIDCNNASSCTSEGIWDNSRHNYMSYCVGSLGRFTSDQKDRMQATMLVAPRLDLVNSSGCTPSNYTTIITAYGPTTFCQGDSVTLTTDVANSYNWSNGATTQSITIASPGYYYVTALYANGCSATSSGTTVTVNSAPAQPGSISGNTTVANGQTLDYTIKTVTGATGYNWQLNGGGTITNGQNTTTVTINWTAPGNYSLSVDAVNGCGNSIAQSLSIDVSAAGGFSNPENRFLINIIPNPSPGEFYLTAKGLINKSIGIEVMNILGQSIYQLQQRVTVNDFNRIIDLRKMAVGIYYVKISVDKKVYLRIITKQN